MKDEALSRTACARLGYAFPPPRGKCRRIAAEIRLMLAEPLIRARRQVQAAKAAKRQGKKATRICEGPNCGADISHRDIQARFCSKTCQGRVYRAIRKNWKRELEQGKIRRRLHWQSAGDEEKERLRRRWRLQTTKRGDRREENRAYYHAMTPEQYARKLATNRKNRRIRAVKKAIKELTQCET